jgi:hypothetical protein
MNFPPLSGNQYRWIDLCNRAGIPVREGRVWFGLMPAARRRAPIVRIDPPLGLDRYDGKDSQRSE